MSFKKRAPRAIKEIRGFAVKAMVRFHINNCQSNQDERVAMLISLSSRRARKMCASILN